MTRDLYYKSLGAMVHGYKAVYGEYESQEIERMFVFMIQELDNRGLEIKEKEKLQ